MQQAIFVGIDKCIAESEYEREGLQGIGIAVPAVVDREDGNIVWGPDWDFLAGASLTKPIEQRYGVPVIADVDTVIPTYGENWAGIGKACNRFVLLAWGTGLGTGVVLEGEVQEYPDSHFSEFGHPMRQKKNRFKRQEHRTFIDWFISVPANIIRSWHQTEIKMYENHFYKADWEELDKLVEAA